MDIKLFKKGDIILTVSLLAVCLAAMVFWNFSGGALTAVITVDGAEYETIDLNSVKQGYFIELDTLPKVKVGVEKGAVWFAESGCPDKLCVKAGKLTHRGSAAACLPAKAVISIEGRGAVDAETY